MRLLLHVACLLVSACLLHAYITYIEVRLPLQGYRAPPGTPWPLPKEWSNKTDALQLTIDPSHFDMTTDYGNCDIIQEALKRYRNIILIEGSRGKAAQGKEHLHKVEVKVEDKKQCGYPPHNPEESYKIAIKDDGKAEINATTVWGALRGLETFSQLVYAEKNPKENNNNYYYYVNVTTITDVPRFKFRSMLMDTARHFQPKSIIKQNIEAMAYNKFNVFHWHMVDDQSWPIDLGKGFEKLTQQAYSPNHIFRKSDVQEIIEFARLRGIRVIPEVDTPGHTQAIGRAYPEMLTPCNGQGEDGTASYPQFHSHEMLNPAENGTFDKMNGIFKAVRDMFKDDYIHLGMDEVYPACWDSSNAIKAFKKLMNFTKTKDVEQYYVTRTLANVKKIGYKYMIWQDPVDNNVQVEKDTIISVWKDVGLDQSMKPWREYMENIVTKDYNNIVLSACWYLNYNFKTHGVDWFHFYSCDPYNFTGTPEQRQKIIGGEACMWGEYSDGTNILSKLWPRASTVAEILWTDRKKEFFNKDEGNTQFRLDQHRCRMLRRGIPAAPILNGYCGDYEFGMEAPGTGGGSKVSLGTSALALVVVSFFFKGILFP